MRAVEAVDTYLGAKGNPWWYSDLPVEIRWSKFGDDSLYLPKHDRCIGDYCVAAGLIPKEIAELGTLETKRVFLGRPVVVGDMGCGSGNAIKFFYKDPAVTAYGIDQRMHPVKYDNVTLLQGDCFDRDSEFWSHKYDYLFCVLVTYLSGVNINEVIALMKEGLSNSGKGYLVVPILAHYHEGDESRRYFFKPDDVRHKVTIIQTEDEPTSLYCAAIKFTR